MNGTTYSYDGNGNLTNDGSKTYTYNAADRLIQVVAGTTTTTLDYDGLGRLLKVSSNAGMPDYYSWCGARICQLRNATTVGGAVAARETEFDDGAIHSTGNWVFFRDQLGTMRKAQLRGIGTIVTQEFGPYGDPIKIIPNFSPIGRYAGMAYLPGIGLYVTPNRAYNANLGRWMNRDPIGIGGGTNLYAYVGDMPLGATDPLGLILPRNSGHPPKRHGTAQTLRG